MSISNQTQTKYNTTLHWPDRGAALVFTITLVVSLILKKVLEINKTTKVGYHCAHGVKARIRVVDDVKDTRFDFRPI